VELVKLRLSVFNKELLTYLLTVALSRDRKEVNKRNYKCTHSQTVMRFFRKTTQNVHFHTYGISPGDTGKVRICRSPQVIRAKKDENAYSPNVKIRSATIPFL